MKNTHVIDLSNISLCRGGRRVLSQISWRTRFGEHWFIMGNNGSGKTTLLEIVMGYLWPQHGSVTVLGKRYGEVYLQDIRKHIGYVSPWVFSHTGDHIPVEDVVASGSDGSVGYFGTIPGSIRQRIRQQLNFFHCENLEKRLFGKLSSGQQLKTMLARALIGRPQILILDEPFSLLDIGSRFSMYHFIEKISNDRPGTQIIMVTHHIDDITSVFTHGLVIKEGRIFSQGERGKILNEQTLSDAFDLPKGSLLM